MKKLNIVFIILLLLGTSSCDKYLDINQDPSFPQVAAGYALMPPLLANMARGETFDSRYIGTYVQMWGSASSGGTADRHGYFSGSDALGEKWRQHYWALGQNLDLVIEDGEKNNKQDFIGAAKAIRAWSWITSSDCYGEMILKQAFEPNRYVFDYDTQEEVYSEAEKLALEAIGHFEKTDYAKSLNRGDLVYAGNTDKWKRFAYAVLARLENHKSNKSSYNANKVIEYVDKALQSNADNFNVPHNGNSTADANFYGPLRNNMTAYRPSSFIIALLDGTTFPGVVDPRMKLMFNACPDGVYRGVLPASGDPNNVTGNTKQIPNLTGGLGGTALATGKWIFTDKAVHTVTSYAEMQFVKAEAAFKKGDRPTAYTAFLNGVNAHLDFVGVTAAEKNNYVKSAAIPQTADALTLSQIMLQKFIAMYGGGCLETWMDMRRYNYDPQIYTGFSLPLSLFPDNQGKTVQRVRPRYNSEYVWNRAALAKIGADLADYHTKPLWIVTP